MVEQILADFWCVMDDVDTELVEVTRVADTRKHQYLWGVHRARAQHHLCGGSHDLALSGGVLVLDADGAGALEQHPADGAPSQQREVRTV